MEQKTTVEHLKELGTTNEIIDLLQAKIDFDLKGRFDKLTNDQTQEVYNTLQKILDKQLQQYKKKVIELSNKRPNYDPKKTLKLTW